MAICWIPRVRLTLTGSRPFHARYGMTELRSRDCLENTQQWMRHMHRVHIRASVGWAQPADDRLRSEQMLLPSGPAWMFRSSNCSRVSWGFATVQPALSASGSRWGNGTDTEKKDVFQICHRWLVVIWGAGLIKMKRNVTLPRFQIVESDMKTWNAKWGD